MHQAAGLNNFGDDTGCATTAPKLQDVFGEINAWLNLPENKNELLYIKVETFVGHNVSYIGVSPAVTDIGTPFIQP